MTATDQVRTLFQEGSAITRRPPRAGVSGTYFFCGGGADGDTIGVFKPMDEEAQSIQLSPSSLPGSLPASLAAHPTELMLSVPHSATSTSSASNSSSMWHPASPPPILASSEKSSPLFFSRGGSGTSESEGHTAILPTGDPKITLGSNANGFHPGEGAYREVAAYVLDHDRFAGVPQTALMRMDKPCTNPSTGIDELDNQPDHSDSYSDDEDVEYGENVTAAHRRNDRVNVYDDDDDDDDVNYSNEVIVHDDGFLSASEDDYESEVSSCAGSESDNEGSTGLYSDDEDSGDAGTSSMTSGSSGGRRPASSNFQTKMGAFQVYVKNAGDADDFGPGVFDKDQVHRIAVLDIRTVNHDRHGGNILVRKSSSSSPSSSGADNSIDGPGTASRPKFDLVPIDHGYILPDRIQHVPWPVWMDWPMIKEPVSHSVREYVKFLDAERDVRRLRDELKDVFRPGALQSLKIATMLLQKGIAAGLTLHDIGLLMYTRRDQPLERSELEKIVFEAEEAARTREAHIEEQRLIEQNSSQNGYHSAAMNTDPSKSSPQVQQHQRLKRHHRHMSSNAIVGAAGPDVSVTMVDEYVVKYAGRMIQQLVMRIAAGKSRPPAMFRKKASSPFNSDQSPRCPLSASSTSTVTPDDAPQAARHSFLSRVRSIPDFGIAEKPLQVILKQRGGINAPAPTPTPASSPPASRSPLNNHLQQHQLQPPPLNPHSTVSQQQPRSSAPIQIPINDERVNRIDLSLIRERPPIAVMPAPDRGGSVLPKALPADTSVGRFFEKSSPVSPVAAFSWARAQQPPP